MSYIARSLIEAPQQIDLVFHQGAKGRYHDSGALHKKGRKLIAKGFASSGRHQHEGISPSHKVGDDVQLSILERIVPEEVLQGFMDDFGRGLLHN